MFLGKFSGLVGLVAQAAAVCFWTYAAVFGLQRMSENKAAALLMGVFNLAMASATAYCIYCQVKFAQEDARFKAWMVANADKIRSNQAVFFRNQRIAPETELVRHHLVFSALIVSFRMQTRWFIKDREPRFWHALWASLYTLCYGWWGFPFGFFWTPVAVIKNLRGSTTVRVGDLLQAAPGKPADFSERFTRDFSRRMQAGFFIDQKPAGILPSEPAAKV